MKFKTISSGLLRSLNLRKASFLIAILTVSGIAVCGVIKVCASEATTDRITDTVAPKFSMAYLSADGKEMPDPDLFTHLIYAFGEFNDNNDGVVLPNAYRLRAASDLKKQNPDLKVLLGIGGSKYEGFSEMAASKRKRARFVKSLKQILDSLNLDGVDFDWEFPGTTKGRHSASPGDARNYALLMRDLRKVIGKKKWISFFSLQTAGYMDFPAMMPFVDYVNVAGYNFCIPEEGKAMSHQSPLYPSKKFDEWCISRAVDKHIKAGVPVEKILIGIPFYAWGQKPMPRFIMDRSIPEVEGRGTFEWDDDAKVPYFANSSGDMILSFEDEKSIGAKAEFVKNKGLAGYFCWNYDYDYPDHRLSKAMKNGLKK